jgi:PHS family inorganic phosphate transporter-like MFS transporter
VTWVSRDFGRVVEGVESVDCSEGGTRACDLKPYQSNKMPQLEVLTALDKAKTQWYHFTAIVIAGMGFFTDAYDLFCISTITRLIGRIYYYHPGEKTPGTIPAGPNQALNAVALVGAFCGQLLFGWLGDKLGRKRVYGMTLLMMIVFSIASGFSFGSTAKGVMTSLCFFRFWLGVGIGGDYPLSATIMSEYSNTRTRGAFIAAVFSMQGLGLLTAASAALAISGGLNNKYPAPPFDVNPVASVNPQGDIAWRILVMLGAIPATATFYYRLRMPETARYTALVERNNKQAAIDMATVLDVEFKGADLEPSQEHAQYAFGSRKFWRLHLLHLIGTCGCWFIFDISYYSQNLFQQTVYGAIGWLPKNTTVSALEEMYKASRAQALIALCGTVPGYYVAILLIDVIGRWIIQLQGFFFMSVFMFALAIPYNHWVNHDHVGFIIIYGLTFFFSNFGPNTTTFIVPAEIYPARFRSTCHGISAASGKLGAIVGAFGFNYVAQPKKNPPVGYPPGIGLQDAIFILASINAIGFFLTFLVPETNQKSLEDLTGENDDDSPDSVPTRENKTNAA